MTTTGVCSRHPFVCSELEGKKNPPLVFVPPPKAEDLASSPNAELLSIFKELSDQFFQNAEDNSG